MSPLSVPNFSPIQARIRVLLRILQSVRKEEEAGRRSRRRKKRRKKPKLWPLVSRKWLERLSSNLVCGLPYLAGSYVATLVLIG